MKNIKRVFVLAVLVSAFFVAPAPKVSAVGPDAANCNWGNYNQTNVIYVSADGCGENCQNVINNAIASAPSGGTVFLRSGTYTISSKIILKSNITLDGDRDAVVKLKSHAGWTATHTSGGNIQDPLFGVGSAKGSNETSHDIVIRCFTIDGNFTFTNGNYSSTSFSCFRSLGKAGNTWMLDFSSCERQTADRIWGNGYYTMINLIGSNFSIHDLTMRDGANDGIRIQNSSDVKIYNNDIDRMGHEGIYMRYSHGVEAYGNRIRIRTSNGIRGDSTYDFIIHDNEMFYQTDSTGSLGNAAIQVATGTHGGSVHNVQIYRNLFHDTSQSGVWVNGVPQYNGSWPVFIHHNIFLNTGTYYKAGGVQSASGSYSMIYNNVFDSTNGPAINGGNTRVINNIIAWTKGAAITGTSNANYNCFYQNSGGDGTSASTNGNGNPLFANRSEQDYHLMSRAGRWDPDQGRWVTDSQSSPCIDWGIPSSVDSVYGDYSKEPQNNGGRVNAGLYGNTSQASLSGSSPQSPMPANPVEEDYPKGFTTTGGDTGGGTTVSEPEYWYPTEPILDPNPFEYVDPALPTPEKILAPIFPELGSSPNTATDSCLTGDQAVGTAGLIPCGKHFNDPATAWDECQQCGLCHIALMGQLTVEFLIKIAAATATLALIFAGFVYVFAAGKPETVDRAKKMIKYALVGFIIIFIAWAIIDSVLSTLGYISPLGGSWHIVC